MSALLISAISDIMQIVCARKRYIREDQLKWVTKELISEEIAILIDSVYLAGTRKE